MMDDCFSEQNDSIEGKCAICLCPFKKPTDPEMETQFHDQLYKEVFTNYCEHNKKLKQHDTEAQPPNLMHIYQKFEDVEQDNEDKFSERQDLVRIDECYHRFHLICLHRDWFMPRTPATDDFGDQI